MSALQLSLFVISNIFLVSFFVLNMFFVFKRRSAVSILNKEEIKKIKINNVKMFEGKINLQDVRDNPEINSACLLLTIISLTVSRTQSLVLFFLNISILIYFL